MLLNRNDIYSIAFQVKVEMKEQICDKLFCFET